MQEIIQFSFYTHPGGQIVECSSDVKKNHFVSRVSRLSRVQAWTRVQTLFCVKNFLKKWTFRICHPFIEL